MRKIVTVIIFILAIISLNACKSTSSCSSIEKQEINNNQTDVALVTKVA